MLQRLRNAPEKIGHIALAIAATIVMLLVGIDLARAADKGGANFLPIGEVATKSAWTGCYVAGLGGGAWTRSEFTTQWEGDKRLSKDNITATAQLGCDAQIGVGAVAGVMADVTVSDMSTAWASKSALDADWQWFVGFRAGYLLQPKTLIYGLVGYTETIDGKLAFKSAWDKTDFGNMAGLTYGGGLEHMFAAGWATKLEYRYVQFGGEDAPKGVIDGLKDGTDVDSGAHQVRLGLVYRFGGK